MDRHPWSCTGTPRLERSITLPSDPTSPRSARQLVREVVTAVGHPEWRDAGELAISEVVTNATLHAHTSIDVLLAAYDDLLCIEVRDGSPAVPVPRHYDAQATTGRGLGLVAALAAECGVQSLGEGGKVIWFCIGSRADMTAVDPLDAWDVDVDLDGLAPAPRSEGTAVVLQAMPATLWLAARQHHDAILRELALFSAEHDVVVDIAAADHARSLISNALLGALDEARAAGRSRPALPDGHPSPLPWVPKDLDLRLRVAPTDDAAFQAMQDALDVAERLAVEGMLLIRPALPEITAVRNWACDQVIAQLAGTAAGPWPGTAQQHFELESHARFIPDEPEWDATSVRTSTRGVVAADDANRIVAISQSLASRLGWEVEDLVGRRVVTLIPPALREAHVAGFSRHLSTGEAHVLGVPLELPVLHADGSEVMCSFLVERAPDNPGRSIYLAWIEPVSA